MKNRTYTSLFTAGLVVALLSGCHSAEKKEAEKKPKTEPQPTVEVTTVTRGKISSDIRIPGELQPYQQVDLYAKVNSYVKKLYVDIGSPVQQGQLLATMEAPEMASQLAGSQSKVKSYEAIYIASKANYNRLLETSKTPGTISPNDLDMSLAKMKSDYAQYQAAKASQQEVVSNRSYLEIRAPFSGVVAARNVSQGAYVGPSGKGSDLPMFTVQTQKLLRLAVSIPETYVAYLNNQSDVSFTVQSLPNQVFEARIKRLSGALDQKLRSEKIEMDVMNTNKKLLPGMVAEIRIPLPGRDSTLIVPSSAIVNSTERTAVIKVVNGVAQWIDVKKGRTSDKKAEVFGSLKAGDTIVVTGSEEVRDGAPFGRTVANTEK